MIEPVRIYKSERGIWHAEIKRDGQPKWFSLHTRDEAKAQRRWANYLAHFLPTRKGAEMKEKDR